MSWLRNLSFNLAVTTIALSGIVLTMIVGEFQFYERIDELYITLGAISVALVLGAIIGTGLAPFDKTEEDRFSSVQKAVGAFATGYILSKSDPLISKALDPQALSELSSINTFRLIAAAAVVLSVAKLTFAFRSYGYANRATDARQSA